MTMKKLGILPILALFACGSDAAGNSLDAGSDALNASGNTGGDMTQTGGSLAGGSAGTASGGASTGGSAGSILTGGSAGNLASGGSAGSSMGGSGTGGANTAGQAPNVNNQALIGYWPFDEGTGPRSIDKVDQNHLSVSEAGWTEGRYGNGMSLDGNGGLTFPGLAGMGKLLENGNAISIWIKPRKHTSQAYLFDHRISLQNGTSRPHSWWIALANGVPQGGSCPIWYCMAAGRQAIPLNEWSHILLTCDDTVSALFVNGIETGRANLGCGGTRGAANSNEDFSFGCSLDGGNVTCFDGILDEIRIYSGLDEDSIRKLAEKD